MLVTTEIIVVMDAVLTKKKRNSVAWVRVNLPLQINVLTTFPMSEIQLPIASLCRLLRICERYRW